MALAGAPHKHLTAALTPAPRGTPMSHFSMAGARDAGGPRCCRGDTVGVFVMKPMDIALTNRRGNARLCLEICARGPAAFVRGLPVPEVPPAWRSDLGGRQWPPFFVAQAAPKLFRADM